MRGSDAEILETDLGGGDRDRLVGRTLLGRAESSAVTWQAKLVASVPDFERLFQAGAIAPRQRDLIESSLAGSDIFRFEAFATDGMLAFMSDQALFEVETASAFNDTAARVAQNGEMIVTVEDGRTSTDRPDCYFEAYISDANAVGTVGRDRGLCGCNRPLRSDTEQIQLAEPCSDRRHRGHLSDFDTAFDPPKCAVARTRSGDVKAVETRSAGRFAEPWRLQRHLWSSRRRSAFKAYRGAFVARQPLGRCSGPSWRRRICDPLRWYHT